MKKKLLSLLLALAMVFTLAACGEKKPDPGKDATATEPVVILHTNDVHGAVSNYAKVAALASQYESEGAYVLSARKFNSEMERHPEWFDRKSTSSGYATYCGLKLKEVL